MLYSFCIETLAVPHSDHPQTCCIISVTEKTQKRLLALDYGTKRVGVAKSDPFGSFAQPVGTFSPENIFTAIEELLHEDPFETIIVGYPLNSDGSKSRMTELVDRFIEELRKAFPDTTVKTIDEYGSSREASKLLVESGLSRKKRQRKGRLDCAAACLILQNYIDSTA